MSTTHPDLELDEGRDYVWSLDFDGVDVSANTYACQLRDFPVDQGGVVKASFTFDMSAAGSGFVVGTIAAADVTVALHNTVWDLKETTPGPLLGTICNGRAVVKPKVTA